MKSRKTFEFLGLQAAWCTEVPTDTVILVNGKEEPSLILKAGPGARNLHWRIIPETF